MGLVGCLGGHTSTGHWAAPVDRHRVDAAARVVHTMGWG